jgi:hypothetical protein
MIDFGRYAVDIVLHLKAIHQPIHHLYTSFSHSLYHRQAQDSGVSVEITMEWVQDLANVLPVAEMPTLQQP